MIVSWRRARLSVGGENLGFPSMNILAKAGAARSGRPPPLPDGELTDAEIIQKLVERMGEELRRPFEARHLALIGNRRVNGKNHKQRAHILGIPARTYWYRVDSGHKFIAIELARIIDTLHN